MKIFFAFRTSSRVKSAREMTGQEKKRKAEEVAQSQPPAVLSKKQQGGSELPETGQYHSTIISLWTSKVIWTKKVKGFL